MKLINKLLPVATLGSVAAIVTPLATSCGGYAHSVNLLEGINTSGWVIAEYDNQITPQQATEDYYEVVSENHDILIHDYMWGVKVLLVSAFQFLFDQDEAVFDQTELMFSDINVEDVDGYLCLSYKTQVNLKFACKTGMMSNASSIPDGQARELHSSVEVYRLPFACCQQSKDGTISFNTSMVVPYLLYDQELEQLDFDWDWHLKMNLNIYEANIHYDTREVISDSFEEMNIYADKDGGLLPIHELSNSNAALSNIILSTGIAFGSYYFINTEINENFGEK